MKARVDGLLDEVERDILKISEERSENTTSTHQGPGAQRDQHDRRLPPAPGMLTGIGTGFPDLEKMTAVFTREK
jgi:replicative DNA helicase